MVVKVASFGRSFTTCITSAVRFAGFLGSALMQGAVSYQFSAISFFHSKKRAYLLAFSKRFLKKNCN